MAKWPSIETVQINEISTIDLEVFNVAGAIWPIAEKYSILVLNDDSAGISLMLEAVEIVSRKITEEHTEIQNLRAYLYKVFKNLVLEESEKERKFSRHQVDIETYLPLGIGSIEEDLDRKILVKQLFMRMAPEIRKIAELFILGYNFREIGSMLGTSEDSIKGKFRRHLQQLVRQLEKETQEAYKRGLTQK